MRDNIIEFLREEVRSRCEKPSNRFGMGCYSHIEAVVKNAALLVGKYGADREVVLIAAWLHDIASVTDYALYPEHHLHGARIAGELLRPFSYDEDKLSLVQRCIRSHRGSIEGKRLTPEELCVADADAISHFDNVPGLLYLAYVTKGMGQEEGAAFVKGKLERSYQKLSRRGKEFYRQKYLHIMEIFS